MKFPTNYKFALYAKVAEVSLREHDHSGIYRTHNFKKPVFEKPNSYINLLGDIIFVEQSTHLGMKTSDIEARCKCRMSKTIDRLRLAGFIVNDGTGYVATQLGHMYWRSACLNFGQKSRLSASYAEQKPLHCVTQLELGI